MSLLIEATVTLFSIVVPIYILESDAHSILCENVIQIEVKLLLLLVQLKKLCILVVSSTVRRKWMKEEGTKLLIHISTKTPVAV